MDKAEPRMNLVNHIKEQIQAGTYGTEGKLKLAVQRALSTCQAGIFSACGATPTKACECGCGLALCDRHLCS